MGTLGNLGRENRTDVREIGNGNRWKDWGKLGLEIHTRNPIRGLGFLLVWSPSILSAFPTKQLGFIRRGLIPYTSLGFPHLGKQPQKNFQKFPVF